MKPIVLLFFLSLTATTVAQEAPADAEQSAAEERYSHLEKGKSGFRETWVNPDIDWTRFDSLYLWTAEFQYRDVGPARRTRSSMMNTRQREFGISDDDRKKFEEILSEAFVEEIRKAKNFEIVDDPRRSSLIMRGAVLDIVSLVPPEMVGRSEVYLSSVGEATLVLELIDARDGEVAAVVAERRAFQSGTGRIDGFSVPTNNATIISEVRRWARREASTLRKALEDAIAGR